MLIAQSKKESNIVEYLIYMYQIEDIIRSFQFDLSAIELNIISKYDQSPEVKEKIKSWYELLIAKMQNQQIERKGHLQELQVTIEELQHLHQQLLTTYQIELYVKLYEAAKPALKEIAVKSGSQKLKNEIDVALHAIYGLLVLRLKQEEIGKETQKAMQSISQFLAHLANYYKQVKEGKLKIPKSKNN